MSYKTKNKTPIYYSDQKYILKKIKIYVLFVNRSHCVERRKEERERERYSNTLR